MRKDILLLALLIITLLSTACDANQIVVDPMLSDSYNIDPVFREFYDLLGGYEFLGPPISTLFEQGNVKYQYTAAALMVHDPQAPVNQRHHLGALGLDMGIAEPPVPRPANLEVRYVGGHIINEVFIPMYDMLGGARYVGRPITEIHFNPENGRHEQHFENLGMFWLEKESPEQVHLLAYGAWKCNASCRQMPLGDSYVILPHRVGEQFVDAVARLGPDFTGFAITDSYKTQDGYIEQVFENIVLVSDPNQTSRVFLRAVTESLRFQSDPLVEPIDDPAVTFFSVEGEKGYNVRNHFIDYMALHGGMEAAGTPIGELVQMNDKLYSQCFTNLCLEENHSHSGVLTIKPAQLGYTYKLLPVPPVGEESEVQRDPEPMPESQSQLEGYPTPESVEQPVIQPTPPSQSRELSIQVWETYPSVAPNQIQEIGVSVFENGEPLPLVEPDLVLTMPDGGKTTYYLLPTDDNGQARVRLAPIDVPNGTLIPYEVCVYNLTNRGKLCVGDSFLIWQNPP